LAGELAEARKEIALLARRKESRKIPRSPEMPCDWRPTTVTNPATGICFTDITAWHYVADLAEAGHPIEEIVLDQPQGEKAFVITVKLEATAPELYIKVQLKRGMIFGRSFHYSLR
jgi:hypothetical protein